MIYRFFANSHDDHINWNKHGNSKDCSLWWQIQRIGKQVHELLFSTGAGGGGVVSVCVGFTPVWWLAELPMRFTRGFWSLFWNLEGTLHIHISIQWRIQDFPMGAKTDYLARFLSKTACKWKKLEWEGEHNPSTPLDLKTANVQLLCSSLTVLMHRVGGKIQKTLNFNKMWRGSFVGILDLLYGGHLALLLITHGNHSVVRRIWGIWRLRHSVRCYTYCRRRSIVVYPCLPMVAPTTQDMIIGN